MEEVLIQEDDATILRHIRAFNKLTEEQVQMSKVILGLLGLTVVIVLIAVPTAIFLSDKDGSKSKRMFTLEDVFNSSYSPRSYSMRWISDGEYLTKTNGSVILHNVFLNTSTELLSSATFDRVDAYDYQLSADRRYVAFMSNYSKVWRHSFTASYHIYDMDAGDFVATDDVPHQIQYFSWAPEGHKLAFVWNYNVYIKTSLGAEAQKVTFDGEYNKILNGIPDWVYEEEMFSSNQGLWWSPGGRFVAYAHFNDTLVHNIEYSWYGEDQYPYTVVIPYPKPGTPNPVVRLFVVDASNTSDISEVLVPSHFSSGDHYLCTVTWATDERMAVQWQKRRQSQVLLEMYGLTGNSWTEAGNLTMVSHTGWVGRFSPSEPVFSADKSSYYIVKSSDLAGPYKHIHHVVGLSPDASKVTAITEGEWEVVDILKVTADYVYYTSNQDGGRPGGRNVYRHSIDGGVSECLTCGSDKCQYNSAYFSHNASFYRLGCHGPAIPRFYLRDNRAGTPANPVYVKTLEDNLDFEERIAEINMPTMRRGTIQIAGFKLWYQMTLPPGFTEKKKYPLLIDVYAGPCSQKADYRYRAGWSAYLASTEGVIVASFDGRGSGYQGDIIMHAIYNKLGTLEVEDQITAVGEFINMGFIDKGKIAIWGWSYGGYVTSMVLGSGSGLFKCGIAVAPVSKWEYYDTIYTERYMNQPADNPYYQNTTVTGLAKNFHDVQYLLVHGTADDNVHFQQAAQISKALVEEQVDFEAMWYTDKDHGIGGSANKHIYTHMSHFLQRCFA